MAEIEDNKRYQPKEQGTYFDDGREIALLHWIYSRPDIEDIRGSPVRVLDAIDEYARSTKYLMNVGEDKGQIVTRLIRNARPRVMVEMGGYVGYSTILFADAVRKAGGSRYLTLEGSPEFAAVIMSLVDLAGLSDIVKVVVGSSEQSIKRLASTGQLERIDMMFLDHWKPAYTTDLKLCEELKLVKIDTIITADNVIYPGNPPYLKYVRSTVAEKKAAALQKTSFKDTVKEFEPRTAHQYDRANGHAEPNESIVGNPLLIYESQLISGFEPSGEPDGIEVTKCIGIEAS